MDSPWLCSSWGMHSRFKLNMQQRYLLFHQCMAAAMIIFTFVNQGRINTLWGLFIAGCLLGGAAVIGFFTGFTLRPGAKALVISSHLILRTKNFN